MKKLIFASVSFIILSLPVLSSAHPGNTAADGCHYCRTNCSSWGVGWNVRHCHGGKELFAPSKTLLEQNMDRQKAGWEYKVEDKKTTYPISKIKTQENIEE